MINFRSYLNQNNIFKYFLRFFVINFSSLLFLYNSSSFQSGGVISYLSLISCISNNLYFIHIILELVSILIFENLLNTEIFKIFLQEFFNPETYDIIFYYLSDQIGLIIFFIINIFFIKNIKNIISFIISFKKLIIVLILILLTLITLYGGLKNHIDIQHKVIIHNFFLKFGKKTHTYTQNIFRISERFNHFFRVDNLFIYIAKDNYEEENLNKHSSPNLNDILNTREYKNIYIIVLESQPIFKNKNIQKTLDNLLITDSKKIYHKKYFLRYNDGITSTILQKIFCDKKNLEGSYERESLDKFLKKNQCYFQDLKKRYQMVFIHSNTKKFGNRERFNDFFHKTFFYEELINMSFTKRCDWQMPSLCDDEILIRLEEFISYPDKKSLTLFLTLNNHPPMDDHYTKYINFDKNNKIKCKNFETLSLYKDLCYSFLNQYYFNLLLKKRIDGLKDDEILLLLGDSPPFYSKTYIKKNYLINNYTTLEVFKKK